MAEGLLSLPRVLGYSGLIVLFDETELPLAQDGLRQRQQHLAHIRSFVDHIAVGAFRGCAVYYAVVEDFIEIAHEHLAALSQRIERLRLPEMGDGRNPRAIWVNLDEQTIPGPKDAQFLAKRIVDLGREAGLPPDTREQLCFGLIPLGTEYALKSIHEGRVREYVKVTAGEVAKEVLAHES